MNRIRGIGVSSGLRHLQQNLLSAARHPLRAKFLEAELVFPCPRLGPSPLYAQARCTPNYPEIVGDDSPSADRCSAMKRIPWQRLARQRTAIDLHARLGRSGHHLFLDLLTYEYTRSSLAVLPTRK